MKTTAKRFWIGAIVIVTLVSMGWADARRYEIKSGEITYKIEGGGGFMGFTSKTSGTGHLYFTDWGDRELREETVQTTTMGKTETRHNIVKIEKQFVYSVDERHKKIIKQDITKLLKKDKSGKSMAMRGKEMMKEMGGKKIGSGKVLGYPCEIWEVMGSKTWIYKGIPLKTEADIMGFRHTQIATSAKFGVHIPADRFKLPNYPVQSLDEMISQQMQKAKQESQDESPAAAPHQPSPEEMKKMQQMLQNLGKMFQQQQQ